MPVSSTAHEQFTVLIETLTPSTDPRLAQGKVHSPPRLLVRLAPHWVAVSKVRTALALDRVAVTSMSSEVPGAQD